MSPGRFEPAVPASEQPQTHDLDRAATGISISVAMIIIIGYQKIPQHDMNELQKTATLGTAHTSESTGLLYKGFIVGDSITCAIYCNNRIAATLYTVGTWFVSGV